MFEFEENLATMVWGLLPIAMTKHLKFTTALTCTSGMLRLHNSIQVLFRAIRHAKLTDKTWFLRNKVELIKTDGHNKKL